MGRTKAWTLAAIACLFGVVGATVALRTGLLPRSPWNTSILTAIGTGAAGLSVWNSRRTRKQNPAPD
jgi:hypothetical protein